MDVVVIVETLLLALTLLLWWQFSWVAPPLLRRGWTTTAATAAYRAACSVVRRCEWRRRERERGLTAGCARRALFLLCGVPDAWVSSFVISKVQKQKTKKFAKKRRLFSIFSRRNPTSHTTLLRGINVHMASVEDWPVADDFLLRESVEAGAQLGAIARGLLPFSKQYTREDISERWR